jgi:hypothetical protein
MGIFELIWLFSLTVGLPVIVVKLIYDYKRQSLQERRAERVPEESLTVGELRRTIEEAVEEATHPLIERIEALEQQVRMRPDAFDPYEADPSRVDPESSRTVGRVSS